jgi:hypothetical protein
VAGIARADKVGRVMWVSCTFLGKSEFRVLVGLVRQSVSKSASNADY